jgi:hypothetical protein
VASKFAGDRLEIGASGVFEGAQTGDTSIAGADLTWRATEGTRIRAEVAQSQSDDPLRPESSTAWLVEGKHVSEHLEARAWARETETGFGVGQQLTADTGTRSAGIDARYKLNERLVVSGEMQHQQVLASDATRLLASADVHMLRDTWSAGVGARHVADEDSSGDDRASDQAFVTGSVDVWDAASYPARRSRHDDGGNDASVDYPARGILGVDYHLSGDTTLYAEYRTRHWRSAPGRHHALWHAYPSVGAHPGQFEHQLAGHGIRSADLCELRPDAGLRVHERWAVDVGVDEQYHPLVGPRAAEPERAAGFGQSHGRFLRRLRGAPRIAASCGR